MIDSQEFARRRAERLANIPLRTLADVKTDLERAKHTKADKAFARAMLLFGRLEPEARAYVSTHYPLS